MKKIGIYIHIPFCKSKCKYCDFISYANCNDIEEYIKCLIYEIDNYEEKIKFINKDNSINLKEISVNTIYFGGGTPSYIDEKYIEKILSKIKEKFIIEKDCEVTIEINPGTINETKIKKYNEIGINRISIGLQSANNKLLNLIGRIHTYEEFLDTYNLCKKIGFTNINVDLMLALPNQTEDDLKDSLIKVINLNPTHISLYSLIIEENTELEKLINNGDLEKIEENIERKMYWNTKKILEKMDIFNMKFQIIARKIKNQNII